MRDALAFVVVLAACAREPGAPPSPASVVYLTPTEHLVRASMALRGTRPSLVELREVARDPGALPALVDRYLASPEFGATVRDLHNEALLLKIEQTQYTMPSLGPLADVPWPVMADAMYDEPLRLIEHVVMTDQPYTTIVTADYTMANRLVATMWNMPHSAGDDWEPTVWPDLRPAAGILASSALHIRYRSTAFNFNRGRANAIARGLLCHDYLAGDVRLDTSVDLADPLAASHAVTTNPACAACHQTLDPLASYFFGFRQGIPALGGITQYPFPMFDDSAQLGWLFSNGRLPSYFGQDAPGLDGLGKAIAADPRFARCAAVHFASYLTERAPRDLPRAWIDELQASFAAGHYNARQLARRIVLGDEFRAAASSDAAIAEALVGYQQVRPAQLRRMLAALTGYDAVELDDDLTGYRVLAGGIDSFFVTQPVHAMTPTASLVARRVAYDAAQFVVAADDGVPVAARALFTACDVDARDDASVRAELAVLHARIYGELVGADDAALDDGVALFDQALATSGDPRRAWTIVLTAMLSDLRALYY